MTAVARRITSTYAYRPGTETPDLELPTDVVGYYKVMPVGRRVVNADLSASIADQGVREPLKIYTNGILAVLKDGHHRHGLAVRHGIPTLPVQVIPDSLARMSNHRVALEPLLRDWVEGHLWQHENHDVMRKIVGKRQPGIMGNCYTLCRCSCKATWKED